jgi:hypothetical protein
MQDMNSKKHERILGSITSGKSLTVELPHKGSYDSFLHICRSFRRSLLAAVSDSALNN